MNRKRLATSVAVLGVVLLAACETAQAQPGRRLGGIFGGLGRGLSTVFLVQSEYIQNELKLNDAQKSKLKEISDSNTKKMREMFSGARDLSREERTKLFSKLQEKIQKLTASVEGDVNKILNGDQKKRLMGIQVQIAGFQSLTRDDVAKAVGLKPDQKAKIGDVFKAQSQQVQKVLSALRDGGGGNLRERIQELRDKMEKMRKETEAKAEKILSADQKQKLEALKGKAIDRTKLFRQRQRTRPDV